MSIERQAGPYNTAFATDPPSEGNDRKGRSLLRFAVYGFAAAAGLVLAFVAAGALVGHRPAPARSAEMTPPPRIASTQAPLPEPAVAAPQPAPEPAPEPSAATEAKLQALRTQVEAETSIVVALRNQSDQARQDLADLQRQQALVRAAPPPDPATCARGEVAPSAAAPSPPPAGDRVVARSGVRIHAAPKQAAAVARTTRSGTVLSVFARKGNWVQVGDDAPWGWAYAGLLEPAR
jgi:hypothetical protein